MNLQELSSIQNQTAQLSQRRHQKSQEQCKHGFRLLAEAEQANFADKHLLLQACDAFGDSIAQQRQAPDAYFGMAYVLFLLKDYSLALTYLMEAAQIDPDHADTQTLLAQIKQLTQASAIENKAPSSARHLTAPVAATQVDYDQLYDELEALIYKEVHILVSGQARPPVASLNEREFLSLQKAMNRQKQLLQKIREQLEIVDQEIDTDELRIKLKTIETMLKRYEQALMVSTDMRELQTRLVGIEERLPQVSQQIEAATQRSDLTALETVLESIADRCDQIADRLDELEAQKHPIHPLLEKYEHLVMEIDSLNDLYDDAMDHL